MNQPSKTWFPANPSKVYSDYQNNIVKNIVVGRLLVIKFRDNKIQAWLKTNWFWHDFCIGLIRRSGTIFLKKMVVSSATIISHNCHPRNPCLIHTKVHARTRNLFINNKYRQMMKLQAMPSSIPFATLSVSRDTQQSLPESADFVSTVGAPQLDPTSLKTWNMTDRHLMLLNGIACIVAVSASCLFFAAIPTLMALKRAAESMEKLLDVTREELPGTMAAVRLSGMEISDLTMELSDLGQEITEGVRNSTQAVRAAEDGLRRMTNMASVALLQEQAKVQDNIMKPAMARTARSLHDGIVQGRSILKSLGSLRQISGWLSRYWTKRKNLSPKEK